eukprot:scaffold5926_cov102-Cylindrotheca_fusiformis.AAC.4
MSHKDHYAEKTDHKKKQSSSSTTISRDFGLVKKTVTARSHHHLVTADVKSTKEGISVQANQDISCRGTNILSCHAIGIALDPSVRSTHCGFCAAPAASLNKNTCSSCQMVSACTACLSTLTGYHHTTNECTVLKSLRTTFGPDVDSVHLMTIRLLCALSQDDDDGDIGNSSWKFFQCLYSADNVVSSLKEPIKLMCSHLPEPANDPDEYSQSLARVLGCSHNITDVSLPLGINPWDVPCFGNIVFTTIHAVPMPFYPASI